jgi:hypothetical protein
VRVLPEDLTSTWRTLRAALGATAGADGRS